MWVIPKGYVENMAYLQSIWKTYKNILTSLPIDQTNMVKELYCEEEIRKSYREIRHCWNTDEEFICAVILKNVMNRLRSITYHIEDLYTCFYNRWYIPVAWEYGWQKLADVRKIFGLYISTEAFELADTSSNKGIYEFCRVVIDALDYVSEKATFATRNKGRLHTRYRDMHYDIYHMEDVMSIDFFLSDIVKYIWEEVEKGGGVTKRKILDIIIVFLKIRMSENCLFKYQFIELIEKNTSEVYD